MCVHHFPLLKMAYADTVLYPEIAGQKGVFTVPVVLVFFEGREYLRVARNFSIPGFQKQIERYYRMMFQKGGLDDPDLLKIKIEPDNIDFLDKPRCFFQGMGMPNQYLSY